MKSIYDRMMDSLNGAILAGDKEFAVAVVNLRNMTKRGGLDGGSARTAVPTARSYVANETGMDESTARLAINSVESLGLFDNITDLPRGQYVIARMSRDWISKDTRVHGLPLTGNLPVVLEDDQLDTPLSKSSADGGEGLSESSGALTPPCQNPPQGRDITISKPVGSDSYLVGYNQNNYYMTVGAFEGSARKALAALKDRLFTIMPPTSYDGNGDVRPSPLSPRLLRVYAYVLDSNKPVFPKDLERDLGISLAKARRMLDELGPGKPHRGVIGKQVIQRPESGEGWIPGPRTPADLLFLSESDGGSLPDFPQGDGEDGPVIVALVVSETEVELPLGDYSREVVSAPENGTQGQGEASAEEPEEWPHPEEEYAAYFRPAQESLPPSLTETVDAWVPGATDQDREEVQDDEEDSPPPVDYTPDPDGELKVRNAALFRSGQGKAFDDLLSGL